MIENGPGSGPHKQSIRESIVEDRIGFPLEVAPILGLLFQAVAGRLARLFLQFETGAAAGIFAGESLQLDARVGLEQVAGQALHVQPKGEVQGVVDDVLGQVEVGIENVVAGAPAGFDAVLALQALLAGRVAGQSLQMLGAKELGRSPFDTVTQKADAAGEKTHESLSVLSCRKVNPGEGRSSQKGISR